jgi:flagellar motor switch/type III secretory pathway protein FliN
MTAPAPRPASATLPRHDRATARRQTVLVARLATAGLDVRRADPAVAPARWIRCGTGRPAEPAWLAPRLVAGVPVTLVAGDRAPCAAAALAALHALEPLIAAAEAALGVALLPDALEPVGDAAIVELAGGTADAPDRLLLALAGSVDPPAVAPAAARLPPDVRLPLDVAIVGPSLEPGVLPTLGPGAALLLGLPPLRAQVRLAGRRWAASADPAAATVRLLQPEGDPMTPDLSIEPLALPVSVRIDGASLSLAAAQGLAPGSVVELPTAGPTLPVTLIVGGAALASGELVALGEGYGVLVSALLRSA